MATRRTTCKTHPGVRKKSNRLKKGYRYAKGGRIVKAKTKK